MPFTFSHPAAVLPFTRLPKRYYSLTGLIVGSVTPDFEYFLRCQPRGIYSHTMWGVYWFDLPLGILLCFLFHLFVRNEMLLSLPSWFGRKFSDALSFDWKAHFRKHWPVILLSLVIGIYSHLIWDAFTHESGYFVRRTAALSTPVPLFGFHVPLFHLLQHGSTLIGAAILLLALKKLPDDFSFPGKFSFRYWLNVIAVMCIAIGIGGLAGKDYSVYGEFIITGMSGGMLGMIVAGMRARKRI